ncbi:hypothetical protein T07_9791 [Trichinella nelsoni]|uniref:Uncharacterized protein n=1 Tax=Trichinella nelsoni TaxID=6336 RepID=A0A0V0SEU1_9BILA|nr:hypothetical protein T07_9791 [Trichinella nelsoni]
MTSIYHVDDENSHSSQYESDATNCFLLVAVIWSTVESLKNTKYRCIQLVHLMFAAFGCRKARSFKKRKLKAQSAECGREKSLKRSNDNMVGSIGVEESRCKRHLVSFYNRRQVVAS